MLPSSSGDSAFSYQLALQNNQMKSSLQRLSLELASGEVSDKSRSLRGNFTSLAAFEQATSALERYRTTNSEAEFFLDTAQTSLEFVQSLTSDAAPSLLTASNSGDFQLVDAAISGSRGNLSAVLATLNTRAAGQAIFAGQATNQNAVVDAETLLSTLGTLITSETTATGVITAIDAWFDDTVAGYDALAYTGSPNTLEPIPIGAEQSVNYSTTALDPNLKTIIKGFALAALSADGALQSYPQERGELLRRSGELLLSGEAGLASVRAEIGHSQNHVGSVAAQNQAERDVIRIAQAELLGNDPYETATELQAVQIQLESLYTMTSRISQLSLMDFLR